MNTTIDTSRIAAMSIIDRNALADKCADVIATATDGLALVVAHGILNAINAYIDAEDAVVRAMSDADLSDADLTGA